MAMTPLEMLQKMIAKLPQQTGRTFEQWVEVARATDITTHKALTAYLKSEYGLNHNQAQWIAWGVTDPGRVEQYERPADLVSDLYSGGKASLRPIYEALLAEALATGDDARAEVCKTYSSVANRAQFAIINPRTQKLVDLELALPADSAETERLKAYNTSNPRFTRRIRIGQLDEVDDEVRAAIAQAADFVRG
jgi:predicted transport protein